MASSKKSSNGRSPLVNQQRQITAFFCKRPESSPSPSPSPSPFLSKLNPNPSPSPSPSPITPSSLQSKSKKPVLVISPNLASASPENCRSDKKPYGADVVDRRIRVYWPLDKSWYEGCVKSHDKISGKHLVQYDDGEEEMLYLSEEKIEWIEEPAKKKLQRLRKMSVVEDEEEDGDDLKELEDDSDDEDWGKKTGNETIEEEDDLEDIDLEVEKEEFGSGGVGKKTSSRKRTVSEGEQMSVVGIKKSKIGGELKNSVSEVSSAKKPTETTKGISTYSDKVSMLASPTVGDDTDRFATRGADKLHFLEVNRRDANGRRPGDANYDPKTLYLPQDFVKNLTGGQRQWWEFKSKHMDKVLFFKMGKFYELFEMDAHVGAQELGLQYMKGEQPHCGFPEKNFSTNAEKLARKGYRVLVVEQTETPEQLDLRRKEKGSKDKVVKREICAVVTKGTLIEGEMLSTNPDASYLLAVTESCLTSANEQGVHIFGICVVDAATSKIVLGQFRDDADCSSLCSLLSELRPVEIIKPAKLLCPETEKALLRHTRNPLVNELILFSEFWDAEKTIREFMTIYQRIGSHSCSPPVSEAVLQSSDYSLENVGTNSLPDVLSNLVSAGENGSQALSAFGGTLFYLRQAFLDETLVRFAKFELLPCSGYGEITQKPYMILDASALENLEIFENSRNGDSSGTLYAQLDHCATAFGKRLLRTWLARPLYHLEAIKERQDAIAELKKGVNRPNVLGFRKELSKLPDMERLLARIFAGSEASGRNANKVVLYEDASKKQLQEFISALRGCEMIFRACSSLGAILDNVGSRLLHHLLIPGTGISDVHSILRHFKDAFDWEEAFHSGRIIPREGADIEYDAACQMVKDIESNLGKHLKEQRKVLGDASISFVTIGKDAYLLEVPESLSQSIPMEYELKSSKKGFCRYWTPVTKKLIKELSQAESEKESKLKSILQRLIRRFCENHIKWRQMVSTIAELDCLISLCIASEYYEGKTCRPLLSTSHHHEVPCLRAKSLGHPVLRSDALGEGTFVTNDVTLGGSGRASFILLTGPNMGGKSTLLRQICLAVILAQIGADVPAESFVLSPIDRIFVRMGAKDQIMAGHSTFLTELSETASMMNLATRNSLVALDELGRGTSTSDGQAIAASVLEHFVSEVQCRGMFSTHYHRLAVDYQNDPKVSLCHMACQVVKGVSGLEEVIFLYKLTPGACPKSYGVNVARLAGLPDTVLKEAAAKSQEFEGNYGKRLRKPNSTIRSWEDEASLIIDNLVKIAASNDFSTGTDSLANLQHRARLLLEQC